MVTADKTRMKLVEHIKKQGWQGAIVSIGRVKDLETEIGSRRQKGLLDPVLFDKYLASFDFSCERRLADARSLIIVAVPQPQVRVVFETGHDSFPVMIPPTYACSIDQQVSAKLVATGISEALITTASGLVVAIPATIGYNYFVSAIDRFVIEMEETSAELIEELERMKG